MRLKFLIVVACAWLSLGAQAKKYEYQSVAGDLTQTRIYTLDNGLKVYLSVNNEKPRIQTYIAVRTGSKNDPAETTGLDIVLMDMDHVLLCDLFESIVVENHLIRPRPAVITVVVIDL